MTAYITWAVFASLVIAGGLTALQASPLLASSAPATS